jgi:hypothetical protein
MLHPLLKNVCRKLQEDSGIGGFLASELPFHGWKKLINRERLRLQPITLH